MFTNCLTLGGVFTSDFQLAGVKSIQKGDRNAIRHKRDTFSWGVVATVGALVNPKSMVFVGLGVKSLNNKMVYLEPNPKRNFTIKNNKVRFTSLIGHETLLANDKIGLRVTYGFTPGSSKSKSNMPVGAVYYPGSVGFKTHEHQVKLGMSYRF